MNSLLAEDIASHLLEIGAVGFTPQKPLIFKSGIISPVYVDNRILPSYPHIWKKVIHGFIKTVTDESLTFEIVAGIESAGIPHSAALGYALEKPSVFCRKQTKDHGTKKLIEGGKVTGKRVLLIEDLVTTGGSSLSGVNALRGEGADVTDCLVIVDYGFAESKKAFGKARVTLHPLTDFKTILAVAGRNGKVSDDEKKMVEEWLLDPWGWAAKQ